MRAPQRRGLRERAAAVRLGDRRAIFYVIGEITGAMCRVGHRELGLARLTAGFAAGVLTDLVVAFGGG